MADGPSDDEVNSARNVLERAYSSWVNDLAGSLLFDFFNETDMDRDDFEQRLDERTDGGSSGLIYTTDQWTCLTASRRTDEALDEMRELGMENLENIVMVWSTFTYRYDVREAIHSTGNLWEAIDEDMDEQERLTWLIDEHSKKEVPLGKGKTAWRRPGRPDTQLDTDTAAYLIGTVDGVGFGWLFVFRDDDTIMQHEFVGAGLEDDSLGVLMDVILENAGDYSAPAVRDFIRKAR